jgi:hypothetical protein
MDPIAQNSPTNPIPFNIQLVDLPYHLKPPGLRTLSLAVID